jgi:hypothetical protein
MLRRAAEAIQDKPGEAELRRLVESYCVSLKMAGRICRGTVADVEPTFKMIVDDLRAILEGCGDAAGVLDGSRYLPTVAARPGASGEPTRLDSV